jgi:hypothetical protein
VLVFWSCSRPFNGWDISSCCLTFPLPILEHVAQCAGYEAVHEDLIRYGESSVRRRHMLLVRVSFSVNSVLPHSSCRLISRKGDQVRDSKPALVSNPAAAHARLVPEPDLHATLGRRIQFRLRLLHYFAESRRRKEIKQRTSPPPANTLAEQRHVPCYEGW